MKRYFFPVYDDKEVLSALTTEYETDGAFGKMIEIEIPDYLQNKMDYFYHMHPEHKK